MKIGYPCINRSIACRGNKTFRLKSYSEDRLIETVSDNMRCLSEILSFNISNNILFFRISSDLVPFASHPICTFNWPSYFKDHFADIGRYIREKDIRISMHPGQYTVLNSLSKDSYQNCLRELKYHSDIMEAMGLPDSAKIQIHIGGIYGDKEGSMKRFITRYKELDISLRRRLVIENDDRQYTLRDCLSIHGETGVPVLLDVFHHQIHGNDVNVQKTLSLASETWQHHDGIPMVDYSQVASNKRVGAHPESINIVEFQRFIADTSHFDFDIMIEIKDKDYSAIKAVQALRDDPRYLAAIKA